MIIFIISHQMYYNDFYYISSPGDIKHKVTSLYVISPVFFLLQTNIATHFGGEGPSLFLTRL